MIIAFVLKTLDPRKLYNMTMENPPFLIWDTSSNGWFFHCHVGFQWCRWILFPRRFIYRYRSSWFTSSPAKKVGKNDGQKKNRSKIIDHPKNHWILLWRGLTLYSRVLGSPNHQFWDPMILTAEGFFQQIQAFSRSKKSTENLWIWRPVPPPTRLVNMDRGLMTGPPW